MWLETQLSGEGRSTEENTPIASETNETGRCGVTTGRRVKESYTEGSSVPDFAED